MTIYLLRSNWITLKYYRYFFNNALEYSEATMYMKINKAPIKIQILKQSGLK